MEEDMSEGNGEGGVVQALAARIRGDGKDSERSPSHPVWHEEIGQEMARPAASQGAAEDHQLPQITHQTSPAVAQTAPPPSQEAVTVTRGWGQNVRLTPADVKRAVLEYVQKLARQNNKVVPEDVMEFMESGDLVLLDASNERVVFSRAVVTWDG